MRPVSTRLSEDDVALLSEIEDELDADRAEVLRRLIRTGLDNWRKEVAIERLQDGRVTLRSAAELADVSYVEMVDLAADAGVDIGYTTDDLHRDLQQRRGS